MPPARRSGSFPGGGSRDESGGGIRFTHDCRAQLGPGAEGLPPRGLDTPAPGCDPGVAEKTLTTTRGRFGRPLAPPPFRGDAARGSHLASRAQRRLDRRRMDSLLRPIRWPSQLCRPVFTRVRTENRLDGHSACLSLLQTRVENVAHAGEAKLAAAPGRVRRDSDGSPVLCYAVVPVDLSEVLSRAQARAAAADRGRGLCGGHLWTGRLRGGAIQGAMPQAGGPALGQGSGASRRWRFSRPRYSRTGRHCRAATQRRRRLGPVGRAALVQIVRLVRIPPRLAASGPPVRAGMVTCAASGGSCGRRCRWLSRSRRATAGSSPSPLPCSGRRRRSAIR